MSRLPNVLEADLTIEPFDLSAELHLADKNNNASKTHPLQMVLLILLLLFSCILLSIVVWVPLSAWAMGTQDFKDSFGLPLLETTEEVSEQSRLSGTKSEEVLYNTPTALTEPILIAPNWSEPLSSPTPLPPITLIPTPTATSTNVPTPKPSPLSTATSIPTAQPFYPKPMLSPTIQVASPTTTPSTSPTAIPTTTPPESDSRLFASMPTSLMIEPELTETSSAEVSTSLTYEEMFKEIGAQYAIDWRLLASVAYQESSLNPQAVGKDDEMGLMQILPTTWDEFAPEVGVSDPFEPYSNAQVGAAYLNYLRGYLVSQGYSEEYWTLVAYNWGPQNMRNLMQQGGNWGDVPPSRQNYAYQIIETINNNSVPFGYNNHWPSSKLKEYISETSQ